MHFNLPLSSDHDLEIDTGSATPLKITTWKTGRLQTLAKLTPNETLVLLDLLKSNADRIEQDLAKQKGEA